MYLLYNIGFNKVVKNTGIYEEIDIQSKVTLSLLCSINVELTINLLQL